MGNGSGEGVYARAASILIYFQYDGQAYRERLELEPTPKNRQYAGTVRKEILRRIEIGTFKFEDFFPNSPRAKVRSADSFGTIADDWLASKSKKIALTTAREYKNTLNYFADIRSEPMSALTFKRLDKLMADLDVSGKTFNNVLSVLNQVCQYAVKAGNVAANAAEGIEPAPKKEAEPDPLDQDEVLAVLADMQTHYPAGVYRYFALWFALGWRPSEGIALTWPNLDSRRHLLTIDSARVRTFDKDTKTGKARDVELDDYCLGILRAQKAESFIAGAEIFLNPVTGRHWPDTQDLNTKYWAPSLKRLGIRGRDSRQVRHTCATLMLANDCRPGWAAAQLGHSLEMFFRVYAKWIPGQDKGRERAKMSEIFTAVSQTKRKV